MRTASLVSLFIQVAIDETTENTLESQKSLIAQLLYFSEKLESSDSSLSPGSYVLTYMKESSAEK